MAPATMRDAKSSGKSDTLVARAKSTIDAALPPRLRSITGRRPTQSESRPSSGVATSWVNEKHPRRKPTVRAEPPIDFT